MSMKVPYGEVDFKAIRTEGYLYIDKTMYIDKLEQNKKIIYTRPRRFGKSMLTNMLYYYYSLDKADEFETLFKGLYIYDHPTPYKNKYYVLTFNFSGINTDSRKPLEDIEKLFNERVSDSLDLFISRYDLGITFDKTRSASGMLSEVLKEFEKLKKQNKIYILIDEYDHFTNGMLEGTADRFLIILGDSGFVRAFYEVIKDKLEIADPPLERFFATGVAPVTLDSLTSGFNIATKITNNPLFTAMCGLTEDEVKQAIDMAGIEKDKQNEVFNKMKENYDGYKFSTENDIHLFNTTLVMYYLLELLQLGRPPKNLLDGNWAATGSKIDNIAGLINKDDNYEVLNELLLQGEINANLTENFELDKRFNKDDFVSMLFYNGYLTIKELDIMELKFIVPNYVTQTLYASYFLQLTDTAQKYKIDTSKISDSIIQLGQYGKIDDLVSKVQEFLFYCSVRDKENFNEMSLKHVFGMILSLTSQFITYAEYPAGQGFADMYIQKAADSLAKYEAIVELKYLSEKDGKKANMKKLVKDAKEQLGRYLKDKRLEQRENLKKFVVIFKGFENYFVEEL